MPVSGDKRLSPDVVLVEKDGALVGEAPDATWIAVENVTASARVDHGHHLLQNNVFVNGEPVNLTIPDARPGDYVRMTVSKPKNPQVQHVMMQIQDGAKNTEERELHSARQSYELTPAGDGWLSLEPIRKARDFGPPHAKVWFESSVDEAVYSTVLDENGELPDDFRLPGDEDTIYYVAVTKPERDAPPKFQWGRGVGSPDRESEEFDHPKMKRHTGPVIVDGVHWDDPVQGRVGNCWLVASLSALAGVRPDIIEDMIEPLDDGRFRVMFQRFDHDLGRYVPDPIEVTPDFFTDFASPSYGRSRNSGRRSKMELWFPLIEKAYAQLKGTYHLTIGGTGIDAFERILGAPANFFAHGPVDPDFLYGSLLDAMKNGSPTYASSQPRDATIDKAFRHVDKKLVRNHAYAVLDAFERGSKRYVKLRNPHGNNGLFNRTGVFELSLDEFMAGFASTVIGKVPDDR